MAGRVHVLGALRWNVIVRASRLPRPDETLPGAGVQYALGGKGAHQAVAAGRMGARVDMAGRVGDDDFAVRLLGALESAGVGTAQVQRGAEASGMSVAVTDAYGDYSAVVVAGANAHVDPDALQLPRDTAILCLQNEVPEAVNIAAARQARDLGALVLLDAAPPRGVLAPELLALTDIIAVNRAEANALTSAGLMRDTLAALRALGPRIAIMTLSADGLVLAEGDAPPRALPAFDVEAISTHGAGDCFLGTLAAGLAAGYRLDDALGLGQAAAALHVSTPRKERDGITPEEVEALRTAQPASRRSVAS